MDIERILTFPVSWISTTSSKRVVHQSLKEALDAIRNGVQKDHIQCMRAIVETNHDEYNRIKAKLPANIFSGRFEGGHSATDIVEYNCLMTLDIDKLDAEQLIKVKESLSDDKYVFAFWLSPSGRGYKGLVFMDYGDIDLNDKVYWHRVAFKQLYDYFQKSYGIELDIKCKDVPRLCFVSYDPDLCLKDKIVAFKVEQIEEVVKAKEAATIHRKSFIGYEGIGYRRNEPGRNKQKDRKIIRSIIKYLEKRKISITQSYSDWYSVAMAIVTTFNYDVGERYFLRLCRLDGLKHDEAASLSILRYCYLHSNFEITLGTLIYLAQRKGYRLSYKAVPKVDTNSDA